MRAMNSFATMPQRRHLSLCCRHVIVADYAYRLILTLYTTPPAISVIVCGKVTPPAIADYAAGASCHCRQLSHAPPRYHTRQHYVCRAVSHFDVTIRG